ncbi:MAG TPA: hypothetical protein VHZ51_12165 [Ktedonobacteraceae bacterium]|nr:hypothetical protein [Ktedonobacteraceae bacterium]
MKKNETGDFCVLYMESSDTMATLLHAIGGEHKPLVIILSERVGMFLRPEDFATLKHIKRQLDLPIIFVIPTSEHLTQLASRNGFPVYASMDTLAHALASGHLAHQHTFNRVTAPLQEAEQRQFTSRKTMPLSEQAFSPAVSTPATPLNATQTAERVVPYGAPTLPDAQINRPKPAHNAHKQAAKLPPTRPKAERQRRRRLPVAMLVLLLIAVVLAGVGSLLVFSAKLPSSKAVGAPPISGPVQVGHINFSSSEQLNENSSQGIEDELVVDLNNVPAATSGKLYYAWLLGDKNQGDVKAIALGTLPVSNGHAHLLYTGDTKHSNLLQISGGFLVTEEDSAMPPIAPSTDTSTWRYYGAFWQTPINTPGNTQHYSYLDHLRHLLAADPTLDKSGLPGGLNNWLYRNSSKIMEWSGSLREQWENSKDMDMAFMKRQTIRTLTYLDGLAFVQRDLPPKTPLLVNERLARVGLLAVNGSNQGPPSYLVHIDEHLNGLLSSGKATPATRKSISDIVVALNNVNFWLNQVRQDSLKIMKMSDAQLRQPATLSLINDMIDNATAAYVGQPDANTGQMHQGVVWIHQQMQTLATLNIATFNAHDASSLEMVPDHVHFTAYLPYAIVKRVYGV